MDPSKLIPAGSVRLHAVLTLKEKGDVAKIKEDLKKVFAATHRERIHLWRALPEERQTEEEVHVITLWKSLADLDKHLEEPHVKEFFEAIENKKVSFVLDRFKPLLQ